MTPTCNLGSSSADLAPLGLRALRAIPPASVTLGVGEVAAALCRPNHDALDQFARGLCSAAGLPRAAFVGNGRSALAALLAALAGGGADEVLVPAYTCWSVASSAARAGLKLRLADVDPETLDVRLDDGWRSPRLAAAVGGHLFGRSVDVARMGAALRAGAPGVPFIEDASQAWPESGGGADFVLLSFARGKLFPLGGGGALLGGDLVSSLGATPRSGGWGRAAALFATIALGRPPFFGLLQGVRFLGVGATVFDPCFAPAPRFHRWQARLALRRLPSLPDDRRARGEVARALRSFVPNAAGWRVPRLRDDDGWIRFPVLAPDRSARDRALASLRRQGVWATTMYPACLADVPEIAPWLAARQPPLTGARTLADRLLTLPVSPTFPPRVVEFVGDALARAARGK